MREVNDPYRRKEHEPNTVSETYRIWLKLELSHTYFGKEGCGVDISPSAETALFLRKAGILFRKVDPRSWVLLTSKKPEIYEDENPPVFLLKPISTDFYYFTSGIFVGTEDCIVEEGTAGNWKKLTVPLTAERISSEETEIVTVELNSFERHFEFLVFPSEKYPVANLEVREDNGNMKFKKAEEALPGTEKYICRFVTTEAIELSRKSAYRFQLWEVRKSGENLLARLNDMPRLQSVSPFSPKDTITSFFYL